MISIAKLIPVALGGIGLLAGTVVIATSQPTTSATPQQVGRNKAAQIQRGKYLVTIMGCGDCHSPHNERGEPIPGRELSGHPEGAPLATWNPEMLKGGNVATISPTLTSFAGPFGVSVAGNLTPDEETGIGKLTLAGLKESWSTGKHWKFDKRVVLPPMPMKAYREITGDDVEAIYLYLMNLKPIKNKVPVSVVAMPPN